MTFLQKEADVAEHLICRYCDERLVIARGNNGVTGYYSAPDRVGTPKSKDDVFAQKSECVNAAGYLTQHEPK